MGINLKDKTVVITGCLQGIGRETLDTFAENKCNIFACAQHETEEFKEHINSLAQKNEIDIIPLYFSLSNSDEIKTAMRQIISFKKPIDALLNIAGITYNALFQMTTIDKMKEVFEIDFFAQMLITQYIAKVMMKQKYGSIINISSITGMDGNPGQIAYSSAKAALIGATKTLAIELGEYNIRVNAVSPGVIKTAMTDELSQDKLDKLIKDVKIKRIGNTKDIANILMFLSSEQSSYITGQVIRVDGGIGG